MRKREAIELEGMNVAQDGAEHWRRAVLETLLDIRDLNGKMPAVRKSDEEWFLELRQMVPQHQNGVSMNGIIRYVHNKLEERYAEGFAEGSKITENQNYEKKV